MNIVLSDSCLGIHTSDLLLHWPGLSALPTISYEENWEMHLKTLNSVNSEKKNLCTLHKDEKNGCGQVIDRISHMRLQCKSEQTPRISVI